MRYLKKKKTVQLVSKFKTLETACFAAVLEPWRGAVGSCCTVDLLCQCHPRLLAGVLVTSESSFTAHQPHRRGPPNSNWPRQRAAEQSVDGSFVSLFFRIDPNPTLICLRFSYTPG